MTESRNRWELVGILEAVEEVSYGNDGKTLANVTVLTTVRNWRDEAEQIPVTVSVFGKDRDKVLNVALGRPVQLVGHLSTRVSAQGKQYLSAHVGRVILGAAPAGGRVDRAQASPRRVQDPPAHQAGTQEHWYDDIPF